MMHSSRTVNAKPGIEVTVGAPPMLKGKARPNMSS